MNDDPKMLTALVIDDNPVIRSILRIKLEGRGWSVTEATDAYRGFREFRAVKPRLITLDLLMPINNGFGAVELAKRILGEAPDTILVVISAFASEKEVSAFFQNRQIPVFSKSNVDNPCSDRLLAYLDTVLESDTRFLTRVLENASEGCDD